MDAAYRIGQLGGRFIFFCTMRLKVIRPEMARRQGGFIIASTHLGHLDPFLLAVIVDRQIDWLTRVEFYRNPFIAWLLDHLSAIKVRRFGVPVTAIRTAITRIKSDRLVGICPEGGVCCGSLSTMRGAPIKRGVGLISYRTGAPVLPCAIIGANRLSRIQPWLPFKRASLWVAFGERLIPPRTDLGRKDAREAMAVELEHEYLKLFAELARTYGISEDALS